MAMNEGLAGFAANHPQHQPRTVPYSKAAADAVAIKAGHPVVLTAGATGGTVVRRGTVAADILATDTKILGFAAHDDHASASSDYDGFGIGSMVKIGIDMFGRGLELIQVYVADGETKFQGNLRSTIAVADSLVGQNAGLRYDAALDQFSLDTGATTDYLTITEVFREDIGKLGGRVVFQVLEANRQFPTP